jgi:Leucine-rich repeat (LRR) protein
MNNQGEPPLLWVVNKDGKPYVRWGRLCICIGAVVGLHAFAMLMVSLLFGVQFKLSLVFLVSCGTFAYGTIAVELQRQRVIAKELRFRLGIKCYLILMVIAACFFAIIGNEIRATNLGHAANLVLKTRLEEVIDEGNAYISTVEGTGVSCHVSRTSFSDDDLKQLALLASARTPGTSQITLLNIEKTSVTDAGLRVVRLCPHLTHLNLPALPLSDESIASIGSCRKLQYLTLDESKLTSKQMVLLRSSLPKLILNGKPWKDQKI